MLIFRRLLRLAKPALYIPKLVLEITNPASQTSQLLLLMPQRGVAYHSLRDTRQISRNPFILLPQLLLASIRFSNTHSQRIRVS